MQPGDRHLSIWSDIESALNSVADPCSVAVHSPMGLIDMGLVDGIEMDASGEVTIRLRLTSPSCLQVGYFANEVRERVGAVVGVTKVVVTHDLGLDWDPGMISPAAAEARNKKLREMRDQPPRPT
jgi:metal-sulfur cluster biosynthetic enzyme